MKVEGGDDATMIYNQSAHKEGDIYKVKAWREEEKEEGRKMR